MSVGVIMNPAAGGGLLSRSRPRIQAALERHFKDFVLRETEEPGTPAPACAFAADGAELVVAVGGDGTVSEVADGLLQAAEEVATSTALGVLPVGTGTDFARGLGLPRDIDAAVARIAANPGRSIDAGRICYVDDQGRLATRHFINIASLGLSGPTAAL